MSSSGPGGGAFKNPKFQPIGTSPATTSPGCHAVHQPSVYDSGPVSLEPSPMPLPSPCRRGTPPPPAFTEQETVTHVKTDPLYNAQNSRDFPTPKSSPAIGPELDHNAAFAMLFHLLTPPHSDDGNGHEAEEAVAHINTGGEEHESEERPSMDVARTPTPAMHEQTYFSEGVGVIPASTSSKINADAPEFVPRAQSQAMASAAVVAAASRNAAGLGVDPADYPPPPCVMVSVEGCPFQYQLTESDIHKVFSRFGLVRGVHIPHDAASAVVLFVDPAHAERAVAELHRKELVGLQGVLSVSWCMEPPPTLAAMWYNDLSQQQGAGQSMQSVPGFPASEESTHMGFGLDFMDMDRSENVIRKYTCRFEIGIDNDRDFHVARRIIGQKGANMKRIVRMTDAKLRLRGKGSGFLEGTQKQESNEPLHLCISCKDYHGYKVAVQEVEKLLVALYDEYRLYCLERGYPDPHLQIVMREHPLLSAQAKRMITPGVMPGCPLVEEPFMAPPSYDVGFPGGERPMYGIPPSPSTSARLAMNAAQALGDQALIDSASRGFDAFPQDGFMSMPANPSEGSLHAGFPYPTLPPVPAHPSYLQPLPMHLQAAHAVALASVGPVPNEFPVSASHGGPSLPAPMPITGEDGDRLPQEHKMGGNDWSNFSSPGTFPSFAHYESPPNFPFPYPGEFHGHESFGYEGQDGHYMHPIAMAAKKRLEGVDME